MKPDRDQSVQCVVASNVKNQVNQHINDIKEHHGPSERTIWYAGTSKRGRLRTEMTKLSESQVMKKWKSFQRRVRKFLHLRCDLD